jgi:hypothetical protein
MALNNLIMKTIHSTFCISGLVIFVAFGQYFWLPQVFAFFIYVA